MGRTYDTHKISRIERTMNLLAYLLNQSDPVAWKNISEQVEGYSATLSASEAAAPYGKDVPSKAADKRFAPEELVAEVARRCEATLALYE